MERFEMVVMEWFIKKMNVSSHVSYVSLKLWMLNLMHDFPCASWLYVIFLNFALVFSIPHDAESPLLICELQRWQVAAGSTDLVDWTLPSLKCYDFHRNIYDSYWVESMFPPGTVDSRVCKKSTGLYLIGLTVA